MNRTERYEDAALALHSARNESDPQQEVGFLLDLIAHANRLLHAAEDAAMDAEDAAEDRPPTRRTTTHLVTP